MSKSLVAGLSSSLITLIADLAFSGGPEILAALSLRAYVCALSRNGHRAELA